MLELRLGLSRCWNVWFDSTDVRVARRYGGGDGKTQRESIWTGDDVSPMVVESREGVVI